MGGSGRGGPSVQCLCEGGGWSGGHPNALNFLDPQIKIAVVARGRDIAYFSV